MANILVTGGTGAVGGQVVERLLARGHAVRILSRKADGPAFAGASMIRGDLAARTGLREAAAGVDAILHCASGWPRRVQETDVEGTRALVEAARAAGSPHFVYISIVGIDRSPFPYYVAKRRAEAIVEQGPLPWSILRATQFHDLVLGMLHALGIASRSEVPVPAGVRFQSIDVGDVADHLVALLEHGPAGRAPDVAGPQVLPLAEMAEAYFRARGLDARVRPEPIPGPLYDVFRTGANLRPDRAVGKVTWQDFLRTRGAELERAGHVNGADYRGDRDA